MKHEVMAAIERARGSLDQAMAGLEDIPETDAEMVSYTAHRLKNYLVEKIGGAIGCESQPGRGAVFSIRLPVSAETP